MKKILFNDKYGLTEAVLEGRKTMTRRICKEQVWAFSDIENAKNGIFHFEIPRYKVGDVVSIAQKYSEIGIGPFPFCESGWRNKMFVRADLMPHHIRITDVRVERLNDITPDDCLKEGISFIDKIKAYYFYRSDRDKGFYYYTAKHAFAALIDNVSGNGVWESNPFVFVYEFELVD